MKYLQRLGRSLMLPVTVLPVAALLNGIGYWIDPIGKGLNNQLAAFLINSSTAIVSNLPLLFAVGIGIGMSKERDASVAISAVVSYLVIVQLLSPKTVAMLLDIPYGQVPLAFKHIENAFVGILSGMVASECYNRFFRVKLPKALSFFSGKRLVPIVSAIAMLAIAAIMLVVWPILYNALVSFGESIAKLGPLGAGIYGFLNRLLIPTGLHHALNNVFWFDVAGINDIGKFLGTVEGGIVGKTGMYQAGFFPVMMFGLPAAAFAMYQCAHEERKKQIGSILLAGGFVSFFTGVTEPLEFSFMFVAPILYLIHAILTGIMLFIAATFQWIAGFGFSAGFIDYFLSMRSPFAVNIYMLIPLGMICGILYYIIFRLCILKFNLLTPGREPAYIEDLDQEKITVHGEIDDLAIIYFEALGGHDNIIYLDSCITRLRVELRDISLIDEAKIKQTGASDIIVIGKNNIQIIVGTDVQFIVDVMNEILGYR